MKVIVRRLTSKHGTMHSMTQGMWRCESSLLGDAHIYACFWVVERGTKRESFNFAMCFIMLLCSCHPAAIKSTVS